MASKNPKRHVILSDSHRFIGRVYDLSIVEMYFDSYEQLRDYPDCLYALHVNYTLSSMTRRVESLNLVGNMLWSKRLPKKFSEFPVSRFDWINIISDVFLMRYISVVDCGLLLTNEIFECGLEPRSCTTRALRKFVSRETVSALEKIRCAQDWLREERNARFHHGLERKLTDDDTTFQIVSLSEHYGRQMSGQDRHGRKINLNRFFEDATKNLKNNFNSSTRTLLKDLDVFYNVIEKEFEFRFSHKFRSRTKPLPA